MRNSRNEAGIRFILALAAFALAGAAEEPPPDLARRVAARETETREAQSHYTYRQAVTIEELSPSGARAGEYREVRDIIFSPEGERTERFVGKPVVNLKRLRLTEEDFRDIRQVQPFLFTSDELWAYETRFKGEETLDGIDCWVLMVRPRQILAGQRLFDGFLWVNKKDYSIVRTEGQAVPQIRNMRDENLFPHFTTIRAPIDGKHWFPVHTYADDTLDFRVGPQRIRLVIRYTNYKRFTAESTVQFEGVEKK